MNPEERRVYQKQYRLEHRDKYRELHREWMKGHPEKRKEYQAKWKKNHPESYVRAKRNMRLGQRYGISQSDYDAMFKVQKGKCAICGCKINGNFCIDHNHNTGKVRGLLCTDCNKALGFARDDKSILRRMIDYLSGKHHR